MEDFFRYWFNTSPQGGAIVEPVLDDNQQIFDFRYLQINRALAKIHGFKQRDLLGKRFKEAFSPSRASLFFHRLLALLHSTGQEMSHEHFMQEDDGTWLHITLTRMRGKRLILVNVQLITEQKKYERDLERRLEMESVLSSISRRLISLEETEADIYVTEALALISKYIGAERAVVCEYSSDFQTGSCRFEWCAPGIQAWKAQHQQIPLSDIAWIGNRLESHRWVRIDGDNIPPAASGEKAYFERIGIRSMIAVPLVQEKITIGFIGFYTIRVTQHWNQNDVLLLETFSVLIANLLDRFVQRAKLQRANQRLLGLHAIDQALLSSESGRNSPFALALQHMNAMLPCERLTIFRIDSLTGLATAECRLMKGEWDENPNLTIPASYFLDQFQTYPQGRYFPVIEPVSTQSPPGLDLYFLGVRSVVILPLYHDQVCIGGFTLASFQPEFFTEEYLQIAWEVASQLAIVLHQQTLDRQVKAYTDSLELLVDERTAEIRRLSTLHQAILNHAGQAITSTDVNGVIQTANQASEWLTGYRPDELIGWEVKVQVDDSELPMLTYQPYEERAPSSDFIVMALASSGYYQGECLVKSKDGQLVPVLMTTSVLKDENDVLRGYVGIATDISALKEAERRLQRTNQELNTFFEGALDLHCITDAHGNFVKVNRKWETVLGYSLAALQAENIKELVHPDERQTIENVLCRALAGEGIHGQENRFRKKDGGYRLVEWNAIGIDQLLYASARDITERKEAEVLLRNLNQRLELATQAAGQGIWEDDIENNRLQWDDRLWAIYGLEPRTDGWSFDQLLQYVHPDDRVVFQNRSHLGEKGLRIATINRIIRPDGSTRYIESSGLLMRNEAGKPLRAIGVAWDVTERELAEETLRESERRFREIAENVDEVYWIHAVEPFRLLYVNPAYERLWKQTNQSLHDNPYSFLDAIVEEDKPLVSEAIGQYLNEKEIQLHCRLKATDGIIRWLSVRTFIIRNETGKVIRQIGIANDITSMKEKKRVLEQSLQREQELNQLKSQFVSTASHEFRTPLTTIQSSADLIRLYLESPSSSAKQIIMNHLAVIDKEISKFSELLTDILTIGRIEAGKVRFEPAWIDLIDASQQLIDTHFTNRSDGRVVQLRIEGTPVRVLLDSTLIGHVLMNLLSNAFKFSSNSPEMHIVFDKNQVVIQVIDTGIGIPAQEMPTLFHAFSRASNASTIPGTGLGLVIARQFVELHQGTIKVQSYERMGTTVTVTLPVNGSASVLAEEEVLTNK